MRRHAYLLLAQVLRLQGVFKHGPHIVLALQLAAHSLQALLASTAAALAERTVARILGQALRALAHAHQEGWCHRDFAPGNVLLLPSGAAVVADWGQATRCGSHGHSHSGTAAAAAEGGPGAAKQGGGNPNRGGAVDQLGLPHDAVGTRWYKPPEVLFGAPSGGCPGDMWAFGMTLVEALRQGEPLCAGGNDIAQLGLIMKTFGRPDEIQWPGVTRLPDYGKLQFDAPDCAVPLHRLLPGASPHALEAVRGCLQLTPAHRLTAPTLLKLPFFALALDDEHI